MTEWDYLGRVLIIDLEHKSTTLRVVDRQEVIELIGGRGLGVKLLDEYLPSGVDPLSPDNPLIFSIGPLTGTHAPMASRFVVTAKSPLTGIYGMSLCGGSFGAEMRFAGYASIIVLGAASEPCYVYLDEQGQVNFRDAAHLWGMTTDQTQAVLREELGEKRARIACIGPAGENCVKISGIVSDRRIAGRTGMGAVMGSKKLKAIVVKGRGTNAFRVYDQDRLKELAKETTQKLLAHPGMQGLGELGTARGITVMSDIAGILPTRNHQTGVFADADKLSGERIKEEFSVKKSTTCYRCPVVCSHLTRVDNGQYRGAETEGPEYETLWSLGAQCDNSNLESIINADMLCDQLGLDTMSAGSAIAFAMECYERGLITTEDTGGLELHFGSHEVITKLLYQMANCEGFGRLLTESPKTLVERIPEAAPFAMHVKGLWLGGYDPRGVKGAGLAFSTANRGGCHSAGGYTIHAELHKGDQYRFSTDGKPELVKRARDMRAIFDSLIMCSFSMAPLGYELPLAMVKAATGIDFDESSLPSIADRICNLERQISIREGLNREEDTLPKRLREEPMPEGPAKGQVVELNEMLPGFYKLVGW